MIKDLFDIYKVIGCVLVVVLLPHVPMFLWFYTDSLYCFYGYILSVSLDVLLLMRIIKSINATF